MSEDTFFWLLVVWWVLVCYLFACVLAEWVKNDPDMDE